MQLLSSSWSHAVYKYSWIPNIMLCANVFKSHATFHLLVCICYSLWNLAEKVFIILTPNKKRIFFIPVVAMETCRGKWYHSLNTEQVIFFKLSICFIWKWWMVEMVKINWRLDWHKATVVEHLLIHMQVKQLNKLANHLCYKSHLDY